MKEYNLVLSVPDDFDPEQLEVDLGYPEDVQIVREGFPDFEDKLISSIDVKKDTVGPNDVVRFVIEKDSYLCTDPSMVVRIKDMLEAKYGCPVIGYIGDLDLFVENADQAIDMLNGMIAKVKVRSAVGNSGKLILPN